MVRAPIDRDRRGAAASVYRLPGEAAVATRLSGDRALLKEADDGREQSITVSS